MTHFLHLTLLYCVVSFFLADPALEYPRSSQAKVLTSATVAWTTTHRVEGEATGIIFQSADGGQTWQDISAGLPENEQPGDFFAGESDIYLRVKNKMYRSKGSLETPVWEKEEIPDVRGTSIAFNRSGVMAYRDDGQIYQRKPSTGTWFPVYTNFKKQSMRTIFETSDGTVFLGSDNGLYKSADKGRSWKQVLNEGWVMDLVESEGVLIGTGQRGIMRSADKGEHWEWVISEGGVGIAVERIDGGFAAISYSTSTLSRRIHISLDRGKTWKAIGDELPPSLSISSVKQIGKYLLVGHPDAIYRSSDMGKTWNMVHTSVVNSFNSFKTYNPALTQTMPSSLFAAGKSGYVAPFRGSRKVFKLFVSGDVVYAVARDFGC